MFTPSPHLIRRFAVVIGFAVVAAACSGSADASGEDIPKIELSANESDLAPDIDEIQSDAPNGEFADLTYRLFEGGTSTLGSYTGTPLVVNFFAAWCPSCITEMPDFQSAFESLDGEVAFLGLSQDADEDAALDLVAATGVTYDIGWDPDLDVYKEFGGFAMPTTAFFSAEGELIEIFAGALDESSLLERIDGIRT